MEIFMHKVDFDITERQVQKEMSQVLHGPLFETLSPTRMNFHVQLLKDKTHMRLHRGTGFISVPSVEIGNAFLYWYGSDRPRLRFVLGRKQVFFAPSNKPGGRPDVIQAITRQPYIDPSVVEERDRRQKVLAGRNVPVQAIQFGWECRNETFSIECEQRCDGSLTFNSDRREIRVNITLNNAVYLVAMPLQSINSVTAHTYLGSEYAIVFSLAVPPSFEKELGPGQPLRQRLSYLPIPGHSRVAPYTSMAIRLLTPDARSLRDFKHLGSTAQFNRISEYEYPIVRKDLFSEFAMLQVRTYLEKLNWCISFQIESILRLMLLDFREALTLMRPIIEMVRGHGKAITATILRKFKDQAGRLWSEDSQDPLTLLREVEREVISHGTIDPLEPSDGSLYSAYHIQITPTTMYLDGPFLEQSNRVIRAYDTSNHESFIRVSFVDEAKLQYRFDREVDGLKFIQDRLRPFLINEGLIISKRRFQFLAYSQSALKEHSVWFVKPFKSNGNVVNASTIIASIGKFDDLRFDKNLMFCAARYAARISQAFTATDAVRVEVEEIFEIEDIYTEDRKYQFTDGVGTLSGELSREIWKELKTTVKSKKNSTGAAPPAIQIRFRGVKGMLSVDYKLQGLAICLRPSMIKFETTDSVQDIEIARAFDKPGLYYLNRPLIMLLEGLGVPFKVFEHYQKKAVKETRDAATSLRYAAGLLERHGLGTSFRLPSILHSLEKLHISSLPDDAFYKKMLEYAVNHVLRLLRDQARIPIPGGWTLVGVADVHQLLEPNQIFACVKPQNGGKKYLKGPVLISRSPTIHPGDVTVVEAIGPPPKGSCFETEPLANTVVFSVKGTRPVPSCLGGGDLDGDLYNLIPLEELPEFTPKILKKPASYEPAPKKLLERPSTMDDVAEFFMEYISSDVVGIVATTWLQIADYHDIFHPDCILLAKLHSDAVDYPKSGQPVPVSEIPRAPKLKPDWNAPETVNVLESGNYYESPKAIGRLFRGIDLPIEQELYKPRSERKHGARRKHNLQELEDAFTRFNVMDDAEESFIMMQVKRLVRDYISTEIENDEQIANIAAIFKRYESELLSICRSHTLSHARNGQLSEEEVVIGTIAQKSSHRRKRRDMMAKVRERTDMLVRGTRETFVSSDDAVGSYKTLQFAWKAWQYSIATGTVFGAQSFGWVALGVVFDTIKEIDEEEGTQVTGRRWN